MPAAEHELLASAFGVLPWQAQRPLPARVARELEQALDVIEAHEPARRHSVERQPHDPDGERRMQHAQRPDVQLDGFNLSRISPLIS